MAENQDYTIRVKRGTANEWAIYNPILGAGELGYDTTNRRLKVGDGLNVWSNIKFATGNSFDVARDAGFDGTLGQWLATLKGDPGKDGVTPSLYVGSVQISEYAGVVLSGPKDNIRVDFNIPRGPKGADGSNVIPARTAIISEAVQPDLVDAARRGSPYKRMAVRQETSGDTTVIFHADNDRQDRLEYNIVPASRYRIVGEISEFHLAGSGNYLPDMNDKTADPNDRNVSDTTLEGVWDTSSTYYTTEIGATWELIITTTGENDKIYATIRRDNRGGLWKIELEGTNVTSTVSTYSSEAVVLRSDLITVPEPGTYVLKGTFMGEDPEGTYTEAARGWLNSTTWAGYFLRQASQDIYMIKTVLAPLSSNKNWATRLRHPDVATDEFFPFHGSSVETILESPRLISDGQELTLEEGVEREVENLSLVQHIRCHNEVNSSLELVDVHTVDTFYPDGRYNATGRIEILAPVVAGVSAYFGMLPFSPDAFNEVVTSLRTSYPTPETGTGNYNLPKEEGLLTTSVAAVGSDPDLVASVRFNFPQETRRIKESVQSTPMFIQYRSADINKVYPRIGYNSGTTVPQGTVWRFSMDYWYGRSIGVKGAVT